jgi:porin
MNLAFNLNPLLLKGVPYSPLGAGILVFPTDKLMLKFIALDTEGAIDQSGFDTVFEGGTTYLGEAMVTTNFFDRPGHHNFIGLYTDQNGNAAQQDPRLFLPGGGVQPNTTSESWAFTYNFDQFIVADPNRPGHGWGIFGRAGVSDGKANLLENFYSIGLGGTARENDRYGVGYYYLDLADGRSNLLLGDSEQGVEVFYNLSPAPWCDFTVNLQMIDGAVNGVDDATVLGFRGTVRF